ncbi:MAG: hypothetical protein RL251_1220, partial [Pseudomonadota bacterium]
PLVNIFDHQRNGRSRGPAFKNARQNPHGIRLLPLRCEARCPGTALVQKWLNVRFGQGKSGRAAIDHCAKRWTVGLSPSREAKNASESIKAHVLIPTSSYVPNDSARARCDAPRSFGSVNIRSILLLHADRVVTRIDMVDFAGNACAQIGQEI